MEEKEKIISNLISAELANTQNTISNKFKTRKIINHRTEFNKIKNYIDNFIKGNFNNRFIVLPGIRGVGKTTILFQIFEYLLKEKNITNNQILYISCEVVNNLTNCNIREVIEIYLKNHFNRNLRTIEKPIFLLIDEAQYDKNWAISGKIIYDKSDNIFMIFTGSSALNLEYNADAARRMIKKNIPPLNYAEHIKLKYDLDLSKKENPIYNLVFNGEINKALDYEIEINNKLINCQNYTSDDWMEYLKYGGFPYLFYGNNYEEIPAKLNDMIQKVINVDMIKIKNFTSENQANANRILRFLALQKPGEISQNNLSNYLETSVSNVKNILDTLEKTHLIFHTEPYSASANRIKKAWKYFFATSSIRYALSSSIGNPINQKHFEGVILEDLVASHLFYSQYFERNYFNLYYDGSGNKGNVDFLIHDGINKIIPIEVGRGKKDKKQVKKAINTYNSDYGIIVSNNKDFIEKEDDVIFISPKTFSFM